MAIGLVTGVRLAPDYRAVEVSAKIAKDAERLMTEGASFWIVRPRVTATEISGLGTLPPATTSASSAVFPTA